MGQPTHRSYLLRLWRDSASADWRATLIAVARPDEQRHFASLGALCAFLAAQTEQSSETECAHSTPDDE